ncbi:MAG: T9SS type A sorting domain-containing protein [Bacteroidales bacterium]|nr:T9SS type A sorting domain-containing protein [Bacteroidales bacterium]
MKKISITIIVILCLLIVQLYAQNNQNTTLLGRWAGGPSYALHTKGDTAFYGRGGYFQISDFSDPENIIEISKIILPTPYIYGIDVDEDYAYIAACTEGLIIVDIFNLENPIVVGQHPFQGVVSELDISGNFAFIAVWSDGLQIVDISDPENPVGISLYNTDSFVTNVKVQNQYAYVCDGYDGLLVLNVSDPANPFKAGSCSIGNGICDACYDIDIKDDFAYIANVGADLWIVNIADPNNPVIAANCTTTGEPYGIEVNGNYAYIADDWEGLCIVDISSPFSPNVIKYCSINGNAYDVAVGNNKTLVSGQYLHDIHIFDVSDPANACNIGSLDNEGNTKNISIKDSIAYLANGYEGLLVLDISDYSNPVKIAGNYFNFSAQNILIDNDLAYVVCGMDGLRIMDISNPGLPVQLGLFNNTSNVCEDVVIIENYAYLIEGCTANCPSYLHVLNVSTPENPYEVSTLDLFGHRPAIYNDFAYVPGSQVILDISDPAFPVIIGLFGTNANCAEVSGNFLYTASDHLWIYDISNPETPLEMGSLFIGSSSLDMKVQEGYAYVANYENGLKIIDISDPENPEETGSYDTYYKASGLQVQDGDVFLADLQDGIYIIHNDMFTNLDEKDVQYQFILGQNYPNPFSRTTTINFNLKSKVFVNISIYNISGNVVFYLLDQQKRPGRHSVTWNGKNESGNIVKNGIYFIKLSTSEGHSEVKRIIVSK